MSNSKIRDNHKCGKVGEFLIENLKRDCTIDVVSASEKVDSSND